ncbi:MAG: NifU family protein [Patescibacteria group bacterium]
MQKTSIEKQIIKIIDQFSPYIIGHGGSIKFISWDAKTGTVDVELLGACQNCSMSHLTLKYGLEQALTAKIPSIKEVRSV